MPLDLRVALRRLHRQLPATVAAVLTLGVGIGAITALFSVVHAVLLRPLPFRAPDRLAAIDLVHPATSRAPGSRSPTPTTATGAPAPARSKTSPPSRPRSAAPSGKAAARLARSSGSLVSGHFFDLLGARPALGRTLRDADDAPGAERVLVLSDALWRGAFGGRPDAVGRQVRLDGVAYTVVGRDAARASSTRARPHFWRAVVPAVDSLAENRAIGFLTVVGRLAPGLTPRPTARGRAVAGRRVARQGRSGARRCTSPWRSRASPSAHRRRSGPCSSSLFGATGARARDRLRQRRQPAARPGARPPPRAGGAHRPRRRARAAGAPAPAREPGARRSPAARSASLLAVAGRCRRRRDRAGRAVPRGSGPAWTGGGGLFAALVAVLAAARLRRRARDGGAGSDVQGVLRGGGAARAGEARGGCSARW